MNKPDPATVAPASFPGVLAAYDLDPALARKVSGGLINATWRVARRDGGEAALQKLNPIFPAVVNEDIEAVTSHLSDRGVTTPRLIRTRTGRLWHESGDEVWRLMDWIPGRTRQALESASGAAAAGRGLGRFHAALADYDQPFRNSRPGVHDTPRHLAVLRESLDSHRDHPDYASIAALAETILRAADRLDPLPGDRPRVVHGDPKINNFVFDDSGRTAIALVDLDTVARMPLHLELGDAFRSWCNPDGEDTRGSVFRIDFLEAGLKGYAETAGDRVSREEVDAIVPGIGLIITELAARFCADALNESYFGWDPSRFASRSEHNRTRAAGQLALLESFERARGAAEQAVAAAFPKRGKDASGSGPSPA